jgi:hypothetical protein
MKKLIFLFLIILLVTCTNKKVQSNSGNEKDNQTNNLKITNFDISEGPSDGKEISIIGEEKLKYFGTVFNSIINDDNVNVRTYPSLKADVSFKVSRDTKVLVTGTSREMDNVDGYVGNWLNIRFEHQHGDSGWVFSKYVKNGQISSSEIKIIEISPVIEEDRRPKLRANYEINGINSYFMLYPHKEKKQNFYTFVYDYSMDFFHYSNIPGTYVWYPETNELKHISYIGTDMESAWVILTEDFKYLIEDFGTGSGPRGLGVWRIEDAKKIFSGMYYKDINLRGNIIDVIYRITNYWDNGLDSEILDYAKKYEKDNPIPDDMMNYSKETGFGIELIILCNLNLDTSIKKIVNGQYIHTQ